MWLRPTLTGCFFFAFVCHLCQAARLDLATWKDRMLCLREASTFPWCSCIPAYQLTVAEADGSWRGMTCPSTGLGLSHNTENPRPPSGPDQEALLFQREWALDCQLLTDSGLPANGWLQMGRLFFILTPPSRGPGMLFTRHITNIPWRKGSGTKRGR